ncbi:MAG: hypothetical protein AABY22_14415 [Nanoarchaeota archaeon]
MSYCRNNSIDSDVYVIKTCDGNKYYYVCFCSFKKSFSCKTIKSMISHLRKHQKNGDKVPDRTFKRLKEEDK